MVENVSLGPLLQDILSSLQYFQWYSFKHIYREMNQKVDELSKEAYLCQWSPLAYTNYWMGKNQIPWSSTFSLSHLSLSYVV
jgi:hypothetical protein